MSTSNELWGGAVEGPGARRWRALRKATNELASHIELVDRRELFSSLVGSDELRSYPVHRWFSYKEGFSPRLLETVLAQLELGDGLTVVDPFGGVATTALAGRTHPDVREVRSVEYSPFAQFAGSVKLGWPDLDPHRLRNLLEDALAYPRGPHIPRPHLAAFSNARIFAPQRLASLQAARDHIGSLSDATPQERDFFLLGIGAVIEDLSGAMKDGRALRIRNGRNRRTTSLSGHQCCVATRGVVKRALAAQWSAMIEDLASLAADRDEAAATPAIHLAGDARDLSAIVLPDGNPALPPSWADIACFSPPYLNLLDYSELYKLELWFFGHVQTQDAFRALRLGTLRSHPSIRFPERRYFDDVQAPVVDLVDGLSSWMTDRGARREVGPVIRQYFEDILRTWQEVRTVLKPGGTAVSVVANSTFSRRDASPSESYVERWRLPIVTDVLTAHLALVAGFSTATLWYARDLRPRNVAGAQARESLVVATNANT